MSLLRTVRFILNHPLNRSNKFRAIHRFIRWQIASRFHEGDFVYPWMNGACFLVKKGETGLTGNIYTGLHEFSDMGFVLHFLRQEDLFMDVGANVGSYTLLASAVVGARSLSFEPVPQTFSRLCKNIRLNDIDNKVQCFNKAVGNQEGLIAFTNDSDTTNHVLGVEEVTPNKVMVETIRLDTIGTADVPILLKIDVEGYETEVLKGATVLLANPQLKAVIMELNGSGRRYGFDESKIISLMRDYGFNLFSYDPFNRQLSVRPDHAETEGNILFIRGDQAFIENRLKSAPSFTINDITF